MSTLTTTDISKAVSNTGYGSFTMTNEVSGESREFELKDLSYDAYVEFCDLARPIIASVVKGFDIQNVNGEVGLAFNPLSLDFEGIIKTCGKELPRLAWIVCSQSDPKITEKDVKRLARRPHKMLELVLMQVKQNQIIGEFQEAFPRLASLLTELAPQATAAMGAVPLTTTPTE